MTTGQDEAAASGLAAYLDASPSPFHAVAAAAALLGEHGFVECVESDPTPTGPGTTSFAVAAR